MWNASFRQAAVEIQQSYKTRPLTTPIGDSQYRSTVITKPCEYVMAILPRSYRHDQGRLRGYSPKHIHAHSLTTNKTVLEVLVVMMCSYQLHALSHECFGQPPLHSFLCGPAFLIGRQPAVATGHEHCLFADCGGSWSGLRGCVSGHRLSFHKQPDLTVVGFRINHEVPP